MKVKLRQLVLNASFCSAYLRPYCPKIMSGRIYKTVTRYFYAKQQSDSANKKLFSHLELTPLSVQRELVEPHRTDERDVGGLRIEDDVSRRYPESGQLVQHVDDFVRLEVVDEDVGQPKVFDELEVHGDHDVGVVGVVDPRQGLLPSELGIEM